MDTSANLLLKMNALDVIKTYRVPDLQALLEYACLSRQGNKNELFQRCKTLISSNLTPQLLNKINQINIARINSSRPPPSLSSTSLRNFSNQHAIVLTPTSSFENLPLPQQIQYVQLPFYEKIRTIECINMPVDRKSFLPLSFTLTDYDVNLIMKGIAKIFLRIAPTIIHDKQNDVLPPYVFIQCNGQTIINNNIAKTVGSQAHSIAFPTDMTEKIIPKVNVHNSLNYFWLQTPNNMSFKNLPKSYTLTIQLVRCMSLESLCENILERELQCSKKDNNDSDIEIEDLGLMTTRHRVSLICPITQKLIIIPTKSSFCSHLTCFDLRSFLQMNERRLQWTCPLCKKPASYETLHVDKRLKTILSNVPTNCSTVEIDTSTKNLSECQYILDHVKQERTYNGNNTTTSSSSSHGCDDGDDEDEEELIQNIPIKSCRQSNDSDCVILSSGSECEDNDVIEGNNPQFSNSPVPVTPLSNGSVSQTNINSVQKTSITDQSPSASTIDDENYWQEVANFTNNLVSINENSGRKRSNSSSSSLLSNSSNQRQRKRSKCCLTNQSQTNDIEIITLSSSDSSDSDDQL
ncbi:hypothetical protein I4U23_002442 [Adineta vaga]|nr:hypothetical protein I4U23_002442 [Adineta vaga]